MKKSTITEVVFRKIKINHFSLITLTSEPITLVFHVLWNAIYLNLLNTHTQKQTSEAFIKKTETPLKVYKYIF